MRIGFFTDTFSPNIDGVVTSILAHRAALKKKGNHVIIFTTSSGMITSKPDGDGVHYHRALPFPLYPQYKIAFFPYISAIEEVRRERLQLIHAHTPAGMGFAALACSKTLGIPAVATFHTLIPQGASYVTTQKQLQRAVSAMAWRASTEFYKRFDLVISPSETIRRELAKHGVKSVVVPNSVDLGTYKPKSRKAARKKLHLPSNRHIVLVAGRLGFEKNVDVIIRAAKQIPDVLLLITGDGPARKSCEALAKKLGIDAQFRGFVPKADLPYYYSAADVFVTASTFETQCLTLLEAMACGTPVVGAAAFAIPEAVQEGRNGFLFKAGDASDCARAIERALGAPASEKRRLSANARKTASKYSIARSVSALLSAYKKVLKK
ncbi:Trehalose synthase [Candidatus Norongarragalina meridionalis]|nr:Trehalose synthase [Candidatus Norongarragalina meridionalis]